MLCHRAGKPPDVSVDTLENTSDEAHRRTMSQRTGCSAKIIFKVIEGTEKFVTKTFIDLHNHKLVPLEDRVLLRKGKQLDGTQQHFIHNMSSTGFGPSKAHTIYKGMCGSYENVGSSRTNFKNLKRDINRFIGESDAHMIVEKFENMQQHVPGFKFHYKTQDSMLVGLFWADETMQQNYAAFGDVVSFDATYRTNK